MRILLLSGELVPERAGGVATYTATIAPALAARGHEVHVLSCAPEHSERDETHDGVAWHRRRLAPPERPRRLRRYQQSVLRLTTALTYRRELGRLGLRFDVIETPEWLAESLLIGATTRIPIVVHLHTPLHVLFPFDVHKFGRDLRVADWLERTAVRRASVVTSASALLAETLKADGWLRQEATIIPLPVDVDAWKPGRGVRETSPNVLVVGRLEPRKAPEVVVEAAEILTAEVPGLQLTFVGRSRGRRKRTPYGEWLAALAERKGVAARFVPQIAHHDIADLYAQARVLAVPSHFESFSIAALEAMACGRPVVYTSRVGAAEILRGTGAGTEIAPNDPHAMAAALRPFLIDEVAAQRAGDAAREVARTRLSPDIIAVQRERSYQAALAHRKGKA
ncbi:MAG: glycosyltransferase family 4 protein [Actinomycetota bacterium]